MSPAPEAAKARLHHDPIFAPGWIYERKLDGVRVLPGRSRSWPSKVRSSSRVMPGPNPDDRRLIRAVVAGRPGATGSHKV